MMRIVVNQQDIDQSGQPGDPYPNWPLLCPVTLALWRLTGVQWDVGVTIADVPTKRSRAGQVRIDLPPHVETFIRDWLACRPVRPGLAFDIEWTRGTYPPITPWPSRSDRSEE
jgi:hypothetical protein